MKNKSLLSVHYNLLFGAFIVYIITKHSPNQHENYFDSWASENLFGKFIYIIKTFLEQIMTILMF